MIDQVSLREFGPISKLDWDKLGKINLIIGNNGSGKTFLLKSIYTAIKTIEMYKRGDDDRTDGEILSNKLRWTFQIDKLSDLVYKGADELRFDFSIDGEVFRYAFGKDTNKQINDIENYTERRTSNSIFIPAKEILSLHKIVLKSRDEDSLFGFDDTYLDLARALQRSPSMGKNYKSFAESREHLKNLLGGKVQYDEKSQRWYFKKGNQKYSIGVTSEGIKKTAILDTLLGNRYLDPNSIIFIDEPESALHPSAVSEFMDIIHLLAESGIQFFLASHSYFVIKKLFLIAQKHSMLIPVLSIENNNNNICNLFLRMPENSIIDESIKLYEEEMENAYL